MKTDTYKVEGIEIEVERIDKESANAERMLMAAKFKAIREMTGMNRKDFSDWLGIPYRTMQEWELGRRQMPDYVLRLIAYKVRVALMVNFSEKRIKHIKNVVQVVLTPSKKTKELSKENNESDRGFSE